MKSQHAQVFKQKEKGRVVEVLQRVVFGDPDEVMEGLGVDSGGKINTAYLERLNLTIRNSLVGSCTEVWTVAKISRYILMPLIFSRLGTISLNHTKL